MNPQILAAALLIMGGLVLARRLPQLAAVDNAYNYLTVNLGQAIGAISSDQDTMARTLYGEARGQSRQQKENVAAVIMNRYRMRKEGRGYPSWGPVGATIAQICTAPRQFSCWNPDDRNYPLCRAVDTRDPAFVECLEIAGDAISGRLVDRTGGADHYATLITVPSWARNAAEVLRDGAHKFWRLVT